MGCCSAKEAIAGDAKAGASSRTNAMKPAATPATTRPSPAEDPKISAKERERLAEQKRREAVQREQERERLKAQGGFISYQDVESFAIPPIANADRPTVELQVAKASAEKEPVLVSNGPKKKEKDDDDDAFSDFSDPEGDATPAHAPGAAAAARAPPPPPAPSSPRGSPEPARKREEGPQSDEDSSDIMDKGADESEDDHTIHSKPEEEGKEVLEMKMPEAAAAAAAAPPPPPPHVEDVTPEKLINVSGGEKDDEDMRGPSTARVEEVPLHLAKPTDAYGHDLDEDEASKGGNPVSPTRETKAYRRPAPPPPPPLPEEGSVGSPTNGEADVEDNGPDRAQAMVPEDEAAPALEGEKVDVVVHPDGSSTVIRKSTEAIPAVGGSTVTVEKMEIEDTDAQGHPIRTQHVEHIVVAPASEGEDANAPHPHPLAVEETSSPLADILKKELDGKEQQEQEQVEASPLVEEPADEEEAESGSDSSDADDEGTEAEETANLEDVEMNVELTETSEIEKEQAAQEEGKVDEDISLTNTSSAIHGDAEAEEGEDREVQPVSLPAAADRYRDESAAAAGPAQVEHAVSQERHQGADNDADTHESDAEAFAPMAKVMAAAPVAPPSQSSPPQAAKQDALDDLFVPAANGSRGAIPPPLPSPASNADGTARSTMDPLDDLLRGGDTGATQDGSRVLDRDFHEAAKEESATAALETPPPRRAPPPPILSPPPFEAHDQEDRDDGNSIQT